MRHRAQGLTHIRNHIGICDNHLIGLFFAQIGKFPEHLVGGAEIEGIILIRIVKALGGKENMPEYLILRVQEVNVTGGNHRLTQFLTQPDDGSVVLPQFFHIPGHALGQHEHIVGQGLDFQEIIERGNPPQLIVTLAVQNCLEQLAGFAGGTDNQPLPQSHQLRLGNSGNTLEILQIGI